jgi:hypothetical protein
MLGTYNTTLLSLSVTDQAWRRRPGKQLPTQQWINLCANLKTPTSLLLKLHVLLESHIEQYPVD